MILLGLLFIPLVIGIVAMALGKGELTIKEFLVQEAVVLVLIAGGYAGSVVLTRMSLTDDTEIWNGRVAQKNKGTEHCCHSYPCNPHPCMCDKKGVCSTCWDTCYRHSRDYWWGAKSTNGEGIYRNGCNAPGTSTPARWAQIKVGEPTAVEHSFDNYIKANPDSIMNRDKGLAKFNKLIPPYPRVFDYYRANTFLFAGVKVPGEVSKRLNLSLREINASLGQRKQLNIIVLVANTDNIEYAEAVRAMWIGGKKNDIVAIIGTKNFPEMSFVETMSWSKSEEMKLAIRDRIMNLKTFDGDKILQIVQQEANKKFVRMKMEDYEYLMSNVEPKWWVLLIIFIVGLGVSIGLTIYFIKNDPFGHGFRRSFKRRRRFY
jgi:hypothetical protein